MAALAEVLPLLPPALSKIAFFWITNFDERKVTESQLRDLWNVIANRPMGRRLVNLYGGFFSICMRHAGLRGFGNGLTYQRVPRLARAGLNWSYAASVLRAGPSRLHVSGSGGCPGVGSAFLRLPV